MKIDNLGVPPFWETSINMVHRSISLVENPRGRSQLHLNWRGWVIRCCFRPGSKVIRCWSELSAPQDKDDLWWLTGKKTNTCSHSATWFLIHTMPVWEGGMLRFRPNYNTIQNWTHDLVKLFPVLSVLLLCRPICRLPRCAECRLISFTTLAASSRYALKIHPPGPASTSSCTQNLIFPACLDCWTTILIIWLWHHIMTIFILTCHIYISITYILYLQVYGSSLYTSII